MGVGTMPSSFLKPWAIGWQFVSCDTILLKGTGSSTRTDEAGAECGRGSAPVASQTSSSRAISPSHSTLPTQNLADLVDRQCGRAPRGMAASGQEAEVAVASGVAR